MLARYYSSSLGRFMAADTAAHSDRNLINPQRWNRYAYVLNNPLKFNDPDGERENPVTRGQGIDTTPHRGVQGAIRSSASNPNIGKWGNSRTDKQGQPKFHAGVDINASKGTPVHAAEGGTVVDVSTGKDAGNRVQVKMADGSVATYAHLDSFAQGVSRGSTISEDAVIGNAGTTGNAASLTGTDQEHLHLAVNDPNGKSVDPVGWLNDPNAPPPASQPPPPRPQPTVGPNP
jgi:murein DD-endopeptidase MepM/ murein hydrolase activator NlpD